jgi:tRNA-dihydrouridine synthase B
VRDHYLEMLHHYGSYTGMRMARKHVSWYTKGLPKSAEFRATINQIPEADDALKAVDAYYDDVLTRAEA